MENNNQKQQQQHSSNTNKKESTNSGGNDDTSPTLSSKPKDVLHDDVCSICMDDVSILDIKTYFLCTQCGKVMHRKCYKQLVDTQSLNDECPMCRAPIVDNGSKEDIERLQKWSSLGKSWAQFKLGTLYLQGLGVKKDPKGAYALMKLAADQGHHSAQFNLGGMYHRGEGVVKSDALGFKFYKLSADQGHAGGQLRVGFCYYSGTGVEQSDKKVFEYYKLAADQDSCDAQFNLGIMYDQGQGVIQSDILAFKYYKLSAIQGLAQAQYNVGRYYYNGTGVEQSDTDAREWWINAAKQGFERAIRNLKMLDEEEGIKTTSSSSNFTDNSAVLCSKCNKPAQTNRTLRKCKCKGAQYCNNTCYRAHWKEHKAEHNRIVNLPPSTGETKEEPTEDKKKTTDENKSKTKKQKPNDRCACGSKKKYKKCCGSKKR